MILEREIKMAEQEDAELTSPNKHIKNTSASGAILTGNKRDWHKDTYTTKAVREIHMKSGRKGRKKSNQVGTTPLGGDTEEEGGYTGSEMLPEE